MRATSVSHSTLNPAPPATGAAAGRALVVGRVLDADTGAPVPGVALWVRSSDGVSPVDIVRTNDDGNFVIRNLPGGRWFIAVTKSAYVGMSRSAGHELVIGDDERLPDVTYFVSRSAAIAGTIADAGGEPMVGLQVSLFERTPTRPWHTVAFASTDDRGVYRFSSLRPGSYVVGATTVFHPGVSTIDDARPIAIASGEEHAGVDFRLAAADRHRPAATTRRSPGAVITGRVTDVRGEPLNVTVQALTRRAVTGELTTVTAARPVRARTDERGSYRIYGLPPGEYFVGVTHGMIGAGTAGHETTAADLERARMYPASDAAAPSPLTVFAPTFHPAATTYAGASPVVVGDGEERRGVDIVVPLVAGVTLSGTVVTPEGGVPDSPFLAISPYGPYIPADFISGSAGSGTAWSLGGLVTPALTADGRFTVHSLTPGEYSIVAQARRRVRAGALDAPSRSAAGRMTARQAVAIGDRDVSDFVITLRPDLTLAIGGGDGT